MRSGMVFSILHKFTDYADFILLLRGVQFKYSGIVVQCEE